MVQEGQQPLGAQPCPVVIPVLGRVRPCGLGPQEEQGLLQLRDRDGSCRLQAQEGLHEREQHQQPQPLVVNPDLVEEALVDQCCSCLVCHCTLGQGELQA